MQVSGDGTTRIDFEGYSSVIIPTKNGKNTVCVSSQIGCPVGCRFCRAGEFVRNLSRDEILGQVEACRRTAGNITSLVFMGTGEPMLNPSALVALEEIHGKYSIAYNRITLSTIGMNLKKLESAKFNVAISLHTPFDHERKKLLPMTGDISEILEFSKKFSQTMIEYALIKGVNDSDDHLTALLRLGFPEHVNFNLIEFNDFAGFEKSDRLKHFKDVIRDAGYKCFIRQSRGKDIGAACGMLSQEGMSE